MDGGGFIERRLQRGGGGIRGGAGSAARWWGGRGASDGPEVGWGSHEDLLQREARGRDARGQQWN
jgi:hypothetical protein